MKKLKTYKTREIAAHCDVSFHTVIRWIQRDELTAYQLPGRGDYRVTADALLEFLNKFGMPIPAELDAASPKRVLIVDDEVNAAKSIERTLKKSGYETQIALSGFEAGALIYEFKPALMTLDLQMPGMSGEQIIKMVKSKPELAATKILVISGLGKAEIDASIQLGADAGLEKPCDRSDIIASITRLLSGSALMDEKV